MDILVLQARRDEADSIRHELMLGKAVVEVWRDGRRLSYNRASIGDLTTYIAELDAQIAALTGTSGAPRRGSMRPSFVHG